MFYNSFEGTGPVRVLSLLRTHNGEYVSGRDLSDTLKMSRFAVWRHIRTIRRLGYGVDSKQRAGYRLVHETDRLLPWEIVRKGGGVGARAYYFDRIGSTQDYAVEMARGSGGEAGSVVVAEVQTRGRGRCGRRWESPRGGIWMSVVLRPVLGGEAMSVVPIAAAVALAGAIRRACGIDAELKWPNDVTVGSKKVAGIITDASVESDRLEYAIVGVGINFDVDAHRVEKAIGKRTDGKRSGVGTARGSGYGVTTIADNGGGGAGVTRRKLVRAFLEDLEEVISMLEDGSGGAVVEQWIRMSSTIGKRVSGIAADGVEVAGTAEGMDEDGALVVRTDATGGCRTARILAGDIVQHG